MRFWVQSSTLEKEIMKVCVWVWVCEREREVGGGRKPYYWVQRLSHARTALPILLIACTRPVAVLEIYQSEKEGWLLLMAEKTMRPTAISDGRELRRGATLSINASDDCSRTFLAETLGDTLAQNHLVSCFWISGPDHLWGNEHFFEAPSFGVVFIWTKKAEIVSQSCFLLLTTTRTLTKYKSVSRDPNIQE